MVLKRSIMVGMTNYTGAAFEDILAHPREWRDATIEDIRQLRQLRLQVEANRTRLDRPGVILSFIDHFIGLFPRYLGDFQRLLQELPGGVGERHVEIVRQLYESSDEEQHYCTIFTQRHIDRDLKDEEMRGLLDEIYAVVRGRLNDYQDLSNLRPRLATFVGQGLEMRSVVININQGVVER
jgi:hypothetical protein